MVNINCLKDLKIQAHADMCSSSETIADTTAAHTTHKKIRVYLKERV